MSRIDYAYIQRLRAIKDDPDRKLDRAMQKSKPKPAVREKRYSDDGKGVTKGESVGRSAPAYQRQGKGPNLHLRDERTVINAANKMGAEKVQKISALAAKREQQKTRETVNGIYRENYMDPEHYDTYMQAYNSYKRRKK